MVCKECPVRGGAGDTARRDAAFKFQTCPSSRHNTVTRTSLRAPQNGAPNCRRRKPCLTPAQRIRHLHTREGAYAAPMLLAGAMPRAGAPLKSQKAQRHRCASLISSTKSPDFRHLRSSTRTQRVPCRQRYCPQTLSCLSTRDL